jgi:hypothetical protein
MRFACRLRSVAALLLAGQAAMGINIDITSADSIKTAASQAAYDMMTYYNGNETGQIPGKLPGTWWVGGAMFMTLMQYWHWTGDDTYNAEVIQGMVWQAGDYNDFMTANYSSYLVSAPVVWMAGRIWWHEDRTTLFVINMSDESRALLNNLPSRVMTIKSFGV